MKRNKIPECIEFLKEAAVGIENFDGKLKDWIDVAAVSHLKRLYNVSNREAAIAIELYLDKATDAQIEAMASQEIKEKREGMKRIAGNIYELEDKNDVSS